MKVPHVLGGCTLLEFNIIDSKNGTTSQTKIEVAGAICGPLAIWPFIQMKTVMDSTCFPVMKNGRSGMTCGLKK